MDSMQEDNLTQLFGYIIKGLFKAAAFLTMSKKTALPYIGGVLASFLFLFGSIYGIHEYIENCDDVDRGDGNRYD